MMIAPGTATKVLAESRKKPGERSASVPRADMVAMARGALEQLDPIWPDRIG